MSGLLAIETSTESCSVALSIDGEITIRAYLQPRRHAELLLPAIRELLAEREIALRTLDAIAFGRGPGSFTSLRIGIGVVQGLAWGAELGVVPVSSLAAVAQGIAVRHELAQGTTIVAAMDARMGEVFHANYQIGAAGLVELLGAESVSPPETLELPDKERFIAVGNGFERYPVLQQQLTDNAKVYADQWPSAIDVILLAQYWLADNEALPAHKAQPHYIRDDVAKKSADQP